MQAFAKLLDRLSYESRRSGKEALVCDYLLRIPDPDRGFALAALTGDLEFRYAKPSVLRALICERCDPHLFALSYDFVGDLSETVALMWPSPAAGVSQERNLKLSEVIEALQQAGKAEIPGLIGRWLDHLDDTERWAFLKLITGGLRVGVSARSAKVALARLGTRSVDEVEEVWYGQKPPYLELFEWVEGQRTALKLRDPAPFRPAMLAHPLDEEKDIRSLEAADFFAEWKWDGIRVQAVSGIGEAGEPVARLYSRSGDDISRAFPDVLQLLDFRAALDGELLIVLEGKGAALFGPSAAAQPQDGRAEALGRAAGGNPRL